MIWKSYAPRRRQRGELRNGSCDSKPARVPASLSAARQKYQLPNPPFPPIAPPPNTLATNLTKALPRSPLPAHTPGTTADIQPVRAFCALRVARGAPGWGWARREQGSKARGRVQRQEWLRRRQTRQVVAMSACGAGRKVRRSCT
ncbi:hypothetical protein GALMADRAFT_1049399 [Galerina marginata CBS 339.88]|uniref:Uncharacterized protein n=1 Tax=Galerina marginata (strain CBS 339.88) TaxID=685588 RepID=A0A067SKK3_GALM3|nr:hypothetical protein GALMADRAFT_1049399 [Galerina marginata CBS 339.88]